MSIPVSEGETIGSRSCRQYSASLAEAPTKTLAQALPADQELDRLPPTEGHFPFPDRTTEAAAGERVKLLVMTQCARGILLLYRRPDRERLRPPCHGLCTHHVLVPLAVILHCSQE